ncbi:MAG: transcriptional regulator [Chloroflexi bacterium HGW-Chloroflexi-10]|nr:MAG: transcriptional regulator [Chloroflexi bacterium HGW-Chloroflexi-10]
MYHPTTRVLAVLELLQTHRRLTGIEMAQRLEVNIRTLRRYITILQDLGIPIIAQRGRYGAYELGIGHKLPPMMFTNSEALSLALGLLSVQHLGVPEIAPSIESARAKLERVLPLELRDPFRALAKAVTLDWSKGQMPLSSELILTLSSAVQLRRRTHLVYLSGEGEETERDFDPYGLAYHQGKWYAVGWCGLRQDLRSFRLDRIKQVNLTEAVFDPPEAFDAMAYVVQAIAILPRQYPFEILLQTDLASTEEEILDVLGVVEPIQDGVVLRGSTDDLEWLARQLARFSFDFVVREPEGLRVALRNLAEKLISHL